MSLMTSVAHASIQEIQTASCLYRLWGIYRRDSLREFTLYQGRDRQKMLRGIQERAWAGLAGMRELQMLWLGWKHKLQRM